jgi:hypothetical protein
MVNKPSKEIHNIWWFQGLPQEEDIEDADIAGVGVVPPAPPAPPVLPFNVPHPREEHPEDMGYQTDEWDSPDDNFFLNNRHFFDVVVAPDM